MRIAVVEGDGIGHEVIPPARELLETLRPDMEFFSVTVGYDKWKTEGSAITDEDIGQLSSARAILFGAVTTPPDPDYRSVIVRIRKELDLYANIRPVWGENFDISVIRENTEGLYSGIEKIEPDSAWTLRLLTRKGCERIARFACELAAKRHELTIGHKANVLKSDVFFRDICVDAAKELRIPYKERYIDALCLDVIMNPAKYDVIVTTNIFGDILSDVSAFLVGGLGLLPSGNIGTRHALFEPVHGSAPDIAGRNVANPIAAMRSAAMLLEYCGDISSAGLIEEAIGNTLWQGIRTPDLGGTAGTREFSYHVEKELAALHRKAEK